VEGRQQWWGDAAAVRGGSSSKLWGRAAKVNTDDGRCSLPGKGGTEAEDTGDASTKQFEWTASEKVSERD